MLTAEVGTRTDIAALAYLGTSTHEGLGSVLVNENSSAGFLAVTVACLPVVVPAPVADDPAVVMAFCCRPVAALLICSWGHAHLDGASGGLLGATNELTRVAVVHAGMVTWTPS